MFLPNPLPTCELNLLLSLSLSFLSLLLAQSPVGIITASWFILNFLCLVKCRHRSQASRKRLGHLPGAQFFLCHRYSSVHSQPCLFNAMISSRTYVCRSPPTTFSLMLSTNEPSSVKTRFSSPAMGRNHST